ncbi:WGR domain-containing protein [Mesorhizobium sp. CGMCC 1.15528]|uniref:WGR domain-containing protein n=1 Tax=Mesorhizobium zhangyense TaxID=1776730 RepID=A0A7C9VER3_9HYPH|nr:WGR domain-containing protein [Mesorhizobium zhangyense]NGN43549.1 WGR domain-containing protein [Mesorhizobium zhangyense]
MDQLQPDTILIHRIDPTRNMARFYALSIEPSLFGGSSLVRNWGRIGTRGRYRIELFETQEQAEISLGRILKAKRRRGYCG